MTHRTGRHSSEGMTPGDLGLPDKFSSWRPHQYDAVVAAVSSDTRFTILNMPPGTGKSATYMAIHQILGGRTLVLTQTKGLQAQLVRDFASIGLTEIKGQSNYRCLYFDTQSSGGPGCDEGPCHAGIKCELKESGCHYYDAVRRAARSKIVSGNYSYWMTVNRHADPLTIGQFNNLILDEAHDAADALAEFVKISINREEVLALIGEHLPSGASIDEWVEWATHHLPSCAARIESAKAQAALHRHAVTIVRRLGALYDSLLALSKAQQWRRTDAPDPPAWVPGTSTDWIIEESPERVEFQPVWAHGYAEQYLFAHVPRIYLLSATVTEKDASFLGIARDQLTYKSYPSPFKISNRPIFFYPACRVRKDMTVGELRQWINRIDQIIEHEAIRGHKKGIIHAVSYQRARYIKQHSRYSGIILIHDSSTTRSTVDRFKRMDAPAILVSPAVGTGWDFPYEECRFQIVAKLPFVDNRPAVIAARHKADKHYLNYVCLVALIQMTGRGVRAEDDACHTYIIDDNWSWFQSRTRAMMPKWFRSAIQTISSLSLAPARP